jgi:ABC-2 type transport system ATP-binding protein
VGVISVSDLRKDYGGNAAVDGLSFEVEPGEVYALLGHNGAGKSTTVEILEGHRFATSGSVSVMGIDPSESGPKGRELRDRIGIVLQSSAVEPQLTIREALGIYGGCYRDPLPVQEAAELVGLTDQIDDRIGTLSGGQRRRIDLGLGVIGRPEVLFLDEPTTGFDPVARRQSWQLIQRLCQRGATVLLTTHYLDEAEHLADRVGVLVHGQLVAEGTPAELMASSPNAKISFDLPDGIDPRALSVPTSAAIDGRSVVIETDRPTALIAEITGAAVSLRVELGSLSVRRPSLEDVFLSLGSVSE